MPDRPASKSVLSLTQAGDRADEARRVLLADWCRLVGRRLGGGPGSAAASALAAAGALAVGLPAANGPRTPAGADAPSANADPEAAVPIAADLATASPTVASSLYPPGPAGAVAALRLPPRAAQILAGLLAGGSEKQIALSLSISPHTVHTHVKQIHKRLNVSSRGELLARFIGPDAGRVGPVTAASPPA